MDTLPQLIEEAKGLVLQGSQLACWTSSRLFISSCALAISITPCTILGWCTSSPCEWDFTMMNSCWFSSQDSRTKASSCSQLLLALLLKKFFLPHILVSFQHFLHQRSFVVPLIVLFLWQFKMSFCIFCPNPSSLCFLSVVSCDTTTRGRRRRTARRTIISVASASFCWYCDSWYLCTFPSWQ